MAASASRWRRARSVASPALSRTSFTATRWPVAVSVAEYTSPMPPRPRCDSRMYRPRSTPPTFMGRASWRLARRPLGLLSPELALQDLARGVARQRVEEHEVPRRLRPREALAAIGTEGRFVRGVARPWHDE